MVGPGRYLASLQVTLLAQIIICVVVDTCCTPSQLPTEQGVTLDNVGNGCESMFESVNSCASNSVLASITCQVKLFLI